MKKPFLLLQLRPEDIAADDEYESFLRAGNLEPQQVHRVRLEKQGIPAGTNLNDYSAVIVGGGPYCVSESNKSPEQLAFEADLHALLDRIVESDFPYLGECYGLGILSSHLGGEVSKSAYGEPVGAVTIALSDDGANDTLLKDLPGEFRAFVGHKESTQHTPPQATLLAGSTTCPVQMIRVKNNIYATQFHPELDVDGLATRIQIYKHAGYFPPEDADDLIEKANQEIVTIPEQIFKRFVERYYK